MLRNKDIFLQDFGAATIKIEVEKSYQDERDNANMKVENIDIKDVKENVDEVLEEEVATDNSVEDEIINQENQQILTTQNQGTQALFLS